MSRNDVPPSPALLDEYVLSSEFLADGEPVRCVVTGSTSSTSSSSSPRGIEILSGSQGGVISRIGGEDGGAPWIVSGSWDGTARVWSLHGPYAGSCLCVLEGHENTVSVAGLPPEGDGSEMGGRRRRVVTVSAGVAEGTRIRGHAVRIWRLTPDGEGDAIAAKSELIARVSDDHAGPIRDVVYDIDDDAIYTCSNDGTVKVRSATDGTCRATLVHPGYHGSGGDAPILLSLCVVGDDADTKAVVAGAEDGTVAIWHPSSNRETQVIVHPGCVWGVTSMVGQSRSSDFATACHDGNVRVFTRCPARVAPDSVLSSFRDAVSESQASRSTGPSPEEVAKLPRWDMNALTQGRSEGQVQVFQRDGRAIAAQWSSASRTWIEVGEVTGTNANAGTLDGRRYDHVLPIEIDVPGGGVRTLRIGYNDGENPFVTAQSFIDEHSLDQGYLAQIADYIRQRAGGTGPTLGVGDAGHSGMAPSPSMLAPAEAMTPTFDHLPMRGYKVFDAGVDKKGLGKVVSKIREFNDAVPTDRKLALGEASDVLDALSTTLSVTNRYHASTISDAELEIVHKMVTQWDVDHVFPALDLARATVLHPDATGPKRRTYWEEVLRSALDMCLGLGNGLVGEVAVPMLTMRLIANSYKGGSGSADAAGSLVDRILECANACALTNNKNVRLSVVTAILNTSSYMLSSNTPPSFTSATLLIDIIGTIVGCGKYESEPIVRSLVALGTVLLLPCGCGVEMRKVAKVRNIGSMVERVANGHGDMAKAVARDICKMLS
ncbi:hypothetical protein ACHAXA_004836 [Cyclostephanos tholiformis]|uniref:Phospholipase A-2-activating protein n=1 Tax=Cyclostephanos tholiformis TaxID=382380 RepID=A0ABD3SHA0_9STRA